MARPRTILLVDPDPASAAVLGPALRRQGFQVHVARDGSRALQLAVLRSPDLVLLDEGTPLVSARTVARILRSNPRTGAIPILRTGRGEPVRPEEPFLRKPFDVDAVLPAVARALAGRAADARGAPDAGVEGSLEQLPLVDVVQMLSTNRRTGRLVVERGGAPERAPARAEVLFQDGRVVDAAAEGAVGEKALVRLLATRSGQFAFAPGDVPGPARIARRTDELLLDALRRADEVAALAGRLPPPSAELVRTGAAPRASGPAVEEVRGLVGPRATLRAVLDGAAADDRDVLAAVASLLDAGEIAPAAPRAGAPCAAAPELLDAATAHALRARLVERRGTPPGDGRDRDPLATKVLLVAAGGLATEAALARLSGVQGFGEVDGVASPFGTAASVDLGTLRLDLVVLPAEPSLRPLWTVLAAGAACALVLAPADAVRDDLLALARGGRFPVGTCGAAPAALDPGGVGPPAWCGYVGSEPVAALRALLARAAGRESSASE